VTQQAPAWRPGPRPADPRTPGRCTDCTLLADAGLPSSCARSVPSAAASTRISRPSRWTVCRLGFNSAARAWRSSASCYSSLIPSRRALARPLDPATNRPRVRAVSGGWLSPPDRANAPPAAAGLQDRDPISSEVAVQLKEQPRQPATSTGSSEEPPPTSCSARRPAEIGSGHPLAACGTVIRLHLSATVPDHATFPISSRSRIAVGTHVTMCPPHRSQRAVFPHRAPTLGV
jgi:hypothetical protein